MNLGLYMSWSYGTCIEKRSPYWPFLKMLNLLNLREIQLQNKYLKYRDGLLYIITVFFIQESRECVDLSLMYILYISRTCSVVSLRSESQCVQCIQIFLLYKNTLFFTCFDEILFILY